MKGHTGTRLIKSQWLLVVLFGAIQFAMALTAAGWFEHLPPSLRGPLIIPLLLCAVATLGAAVAVSRRENRSAEIHANLEDTVQQQTRSLMITRDAVIFGLAKLAEYRDYDTGGHLDRIRDYVVVLARKLRHRYPEIDEAYIANLALASSLHDIGKVGIPDAILLKPGPLDARDRKIMEAHTEIGAQCLAAIKARLGEDDFLQMAQDIALCHHEHVDGKGYPRGLRGDEIPLAARIVAVADVYDALRSERVYKRSLPHNQAKQIIVSEAGKQFDWSVAHAFLLAEGAMRRIAEKYHGTTSPGLTLESEDTSELHNLLARPCFAVSKDDSL